MTIHVRLERSDAVVERIPEGELPSISEAKILGPFEWVQLTYHALRVAPDGEEIAWFDAKDDVWKIIDVPEPKGQLERVYSSSSKADVDYPWSDVVIY